MVWVLHGIVPGLLGWLGLLPIAAQGEDAAPRPPNIILILADDLGWAELGCYGNTFKGNAPP